jgi:hypothetical protein
VQWKKLSLSAGYIYILPQNELPMLSEVSYSKRISAVDLHDLMALTEQG